MRSEDIDELQISSCCNTSGKGPKGMAVDGDGGLLGINPKSPAVV